MPDSDEQIDLTRGHTMRPATYNKNNKKIAALKTKAQEQQDKADRHKDSDYIILLICTLAVDLLGFAGFIILAFLFSFVVWLINAYLWWKNRDLWEREDYTVAIATSIIESIPLIGMLPAATANAFQKWYRSGIRAKGHQAKADDYNKQAEQLQKRQRRERAQRAARQLYSNLPDSNPPTYTPSPPSDTDDNEES